MSIKQNVLIAITYGQKENENIIQTFDLQYKITKSLNTKFFLHCLIKKNKFSILQTNNEMLV